MFYFIYDVLIFIAGLIYLPFYAFRGRLHSKILGRLGIFSKDLYGNLNNTGIYDGVVWFHAVSVGEARSSESLLNLIRKECPSKRIVVSCVTPTGMEIIKKLLKDTEVVFFAPLDISWAVSRFLKIINPEMLIIAETEIWPNLIRLTKKHGASVFIVNARISDKSFAKYKLVRSFFKRIASDVDLFCAQTEEAARRLILLGADEKKVKFAGNIKFDISSDLSETPLIKRLKDAFKDSLLIIAGSTHENEEEAIVSIYKSLRKDFPDLRLLIAPRHLERLDKVRRLIRLQGLEAVNLSRKKNFSSVQIAVLDTMGDLNALYQLCDVAFVGGSLVAKGGHNPIEPALFAKAVIFGPHMENFKEIRDIFLKEDAAIQVEGTEGLEYELRRLFSDSSLRTELGRRARAILDKNRGAALRTFSYIKNKADKK